jgi:NTE family protein
MPATGPEPPDALVLGGGGVLGEAWLSAVLAGIEDGGGFDARTCGCFLGTSAGSIVASSLAAGIDPRERLELSRREPGAHFPEEPPSAARGAVSEGLAAALELGGVAAAPLASMALSSSTGGGALVRRAVLGRLPRGTRSLARLGQFVAQGGAGFDGRLLISAVELASGRRVVFGDGAAPTATVADAVMASCAIPGFFAPVDIGGVSYVDGGVWSPTNMDALPVGRGAQVVCLNPTGSLRGERRGLAGMVGPISRGISAGEALALRHRGAIVDVVSPDAASGAAMGLDLMDPSRREPVIAAAHEQGLRLAARARAA